MKQFSSGTVAPPTAGCCRLRLFRLLSAELLCSAYYPWLPGCTAAYPGCHGHHALNPSFSIHPTHLPIPYIYLLHIVKSAWIAHISPQIACFIVYIWSFWTNMLLQCLKPARPQAIPPIAQVAYLHHKYWHEIIMEGGFSGVQLIIILKSALSWM